MKANLFVPASRLSGSLEKVLRRILRSEKDACHGLDIESVHDLRVALRRCRSLAEGFVEMDPQPAWRDLRKACGKQQSGLSELRDAQVLAEWIRRLGLGRGPDARTLVEAFMKEKRHGRRKAKSLLKSFSRKQWKEWRRALPKRAGELTVGPSRLARIVFDRATDVCLLERRWRRGHSGVAWHRLRLGVKRFRYAVESFLPAQHVAWGQQLKRLQDMLGEGHDLDVLRARILLLSNQGDVAAESREEWLRKIATAKDRRTTRYLRASAVVGRGHAQRGAGRRGRGVNNPPQARYIYDSWRMDLGRLAKVNPEDVVKPMRSAAIRG